MTLSEIIKSYIEENTMTQFVKDSGLSRSYCYMLINNKNNHGDRVIPTVQTLESVSKGIHMPLDKLIDKLDDDEVVKLLPGYSEQKHRMNKYAELIYGKELVPEKETTSGNEKNIIPVVGRVAAGYPIEMVEEIIDTEEIPEAMARRGQYFGLLIKGDSMEPRIYDGDVVIVKKQDYCDNNDIAIVTVNGYDATCKRILKSEGGITLMPLNTRHTPQMFTNEQIENIPVRIIGLVVEVRGKLKF